HVIGLAAERHSLRGHLQCHHHHPPDSAGIARRAVPAARRRGAVPALDAALWRRRHHRPVHRDQADRPRPGRPGCNMKILVIALRATLVTLVVTGIVYPLAATGLAQVLFPAKANGSIVTDDQGHEVGSELIGQGFSNPAYFQSRPSAAGDKGWDATSSSASNLGPTSQKLHDRAKADAERLAAENPDTTGPIPAEPATAAGT